MTLRLILTRHAKSNWDNPLDTDHQRPLAPRGLRAAPLIGQWLRARGYVPGEALVSDATRTRQTWALLQAEFTAESPARFEPALYLAAPEVMLRALQTARAETVMMLGHNPGIAEFAHQLLRRPLSHPGFAGFPTCATLVAEFDIDQWAELQLGTGRARDFVVPRELAQG